MGACFAWCLTVPSVVWAFDTFWVTRISASVGEIKDDWWWLRFVGSTSATLESVVSTPSSSSQETVVHLELDVPQGAVLTRIRVYGTDNTGSGAITTRCFAPPYNSEAHESYEFASFASASGSSYWSSATLSVPVDHASSTYLCRLEFDGAAGTNLRAHTLEARYTP